MMKIMLIWWVMTDSGITEPVEYDGWVSMEACEIAAESLTEPNPKDDSAGFAVIARCVEVPK
jgi:hypothetical protein